MSFPDRLRYLREKKNLTQTELGKIFNLSKQAISSYENSGSAPSQGTLIKMANFFYVSINYLLDIEEKDIPPGIYQFAFDDNNYPLIKAIQSAQESGFTNEAISGWIETLKSSLITQKEKHRK